MRRRPVEASRRHARGRPRTLFSERGRAAILGLAHRFNEANFYETRDGVVHMMLRNENGTRMVAPASHRLHQLGVALALSDDGVVFDRHYVIGDDTQGEPRIPGYLKHGRYGYPFLAVAGDAALVVYSTNKEDINLARFRLPEP